MGVPKNRAQRHAKYERLKDETLRLLLDGLEVGSIAELKRLVDRGRLPVVAGKTLHLEAGSDIGGVSHRMTATYRIEYVDGSVETAHVDKIEWALSEELTTRGET